MTEILMSIEGPYFKDELDVWVDWTLPFLPRVGEWINSWVWIEGNSFDVEEIKKILTAEGLKSLEKWDGELKDWLYEYSDCVVKSVSYYRNQNDNSIYTIVHLADE